MNDVASRYLPIDRYAVIGDCRSAALISDRGSMDWLCLPRFDSPSLFGAILDAERGGRFAIHPAGAFESSRRYVGDTNVLETTFRTDSGSMQLIDVVPVASEEDKAREMWPERHLIRALQGLDGEVEVEVHYDPRPEYGRRVPRLENRGRLGIDCQLGSHRLALRSDIPLTGTPDRPGARGSAKLRAGDRRYLSLAFSSIEPSVLPPSGEVAEQRIAQSLKWWEEWASRCRYHGRYRASVMRSALVLKLMIYAPSGAIVAAPTTSLPEWPAGERNWDYRYSWLRDASMTLESLMRLGYEDEGEAFLDWMLLATQLTWPELQVLYDVYGETRLHERTLDHLEGYVGSRPVRIGNDAILQNQLDIYGAVVDAAIQFTVRGQKIDQPRARRLVDLGKTVCRKWREPDHGIWEMRTVPAHYTSSKASAWAALDALLELHEKGHVNVPVRQFTAERDAIRQAIETQGFDERRGSYVTSFGAEDVDASLLLLALRRYADPRSPRMRSTLARIRAELGAGELLYRYRPVIDGLPGSEGAFGICCFWSAACRALEGEADVAASEFERLLSYANDLGLFAEEIDPASGLALGNFPQAYTHVGLIHAALTIQEAERGPSPS